MKRRIFSILFVALCALSVFADSETELDSLYNRFQIEEVEVAARALAKDVIVPQTLKGAELQRLNALSVADALRYFSGVQLKDYGGVGGITWFFPDDIHPRMWQATVKLTCSILARETSTYAREMYIDCIYLHHPAGDYAGAWKDLEKAYRQGKVRALGISNFDNWPEAFSAIVDEMEIKPQILQIECHPFAQRLETRELAAKYDIQVECWYPLGHADDRLLNNDVLSAIARAHGKSVVQIILRWHMQEGLVAVPGSTNPAHIQENIAIFDFELTDDEMAQIRALDRGEAGRYFNIDYQRMGGFFTTLNE